MKTDKNRRIIKGCFSGLAIVVLLFSVTACSQKYSNPMQYMIDNSTTASTSKENESTKQDKDLDIVKGVLTFDTTTFVKADKVYNDKQWLSMAASFKEAVKESEVKEIVIVADKQIKDEVEYFLKVTGNTEKKVSVVSDRSEIPSESKSEAATTSTSYNTSTNVTTDTKTSSVSEANIDSTANTSASTTLDKYNFDLTEVKALPTVEIMYDSITSDGSLLEKALNTFDGLVIITENSDGQLSYNTKQILGDIEKLKNVVVISRKLMQEKSLTPMKVKVLLTLSLATGKELSIK